MMTEQDMARKSAGLRGLMQQKLNIRARDLRQALGRAGRRLPRGLRRRGAALVRAETLVQNPKTARQVDVQAVERDFEALRAYLEALDVAEMRKTRALALAAAVAGNLIVVAAGFIVWLWWRGYL